MKRHSIALVIRELQLKTTKYHCNLLEWQNPKTLTTANAGEDVEQQELSFIAGRMQNTAATFKSYSFL